MSEPQSKRRRVTRACDECRKKKVKCDGQQPCIHCTVYSYECTYNQPTKRGGSCAPQTITVRKPVKTAKQLQATISKYRTLFQEVFPGLPDIDSLDVQTFAQIYHNFNRDNHHLKDTVTEYNLISHNGEAAATTVTTTSTPDVSSAAEAIENVDGSIQSNEGREIKILLPPKHIALRFIKNTWQHCCVLFRFYHRPSFIKNLDQLYETDPQNYTDEQMNFLPLCYAVMAVGALFSKSMMDSNDIADEDSQPDQFLKDEGYKYFIAARKLIDITNARDLNSIQTIVMLFIFLQCSARLSTCYAYIGVAMRSALREGLHRNLTMGAPGFTPIEIEMRKRLFFTIYKMDIYLNTMLGLPRAISQRDFDQSFPLEIDDEYITEDGIYPERQGDELSSAGIANQHTKLIMILDNIVSELYPIKKTNNLISHEVVTNLELKLRQWLNQLPPELIPGLEDVPPKFYKANRLLHLSFLQVQIVLYRPFIHYLSRTAPRRDPLSIQRAKNCISVARTVVTLAQEMIQKRMLTGSYWFSIYTIFFSVAGMIFYIHEVTPTDEESSREYEQVVKDTELGKKVLLQLKDASMAANRTYNILNQLFERLNSRTIKLTSEQLRKPQSQPQTTSTVDSLSVKEDATPDIKETAASGFDAINSPNSYSVNNFTTLDPNAMFENPQEFFMQPAITITGVNTANTTNTSNILSNTDFLPKSDSPLDKYFQIDDTIGVALEDKSGALIGNYNREASSSGVSTSGIASSSIDSESLATPTVNGESDKNLPKTASTAIEEPQDATGSYVPGVFDQLDVQLFGRYLPPYMSQQNDEFMEASDTKKV